MKLCLPLRCAAWLLAWAAFGTVVCCYGQFGNMPTPAADGASPPMMIVPPGRETLQALNHAREALKQGRTADAFPLLQRLIELPEDYFTDKSMQHTLKSETLRLLAGLTSTERDAYELLQGTSARSLLAEVKAAGDADRLAEIVRRYPWTHASLEAAELLALDALDHGRTWQAAVQFSQLRQSPVLSPLQSRHMGLREALAWHQAGQPERGAILMQEIASQSPPLRVDVAGQPLPAIADVRQAGRWLAEVSGQPGRQAEQELTDWTSPRGSPAGSAAVQETGPIGGPAWRVKHLASLEDDLPPQPGRGLRDGLLQQMDHAEEPQIEAERLTWATLTPLVVGDFVIARTARDVAAWDRKTGELRWRSVLTDPEFDQLWAAAPAPANGQDQGNGSTLVQYLRTRCLEDRTFGSLSSDGQFVFAVEGLEHATMPMPGGFGQVRVFNPNAEDADNATNRLTAYELDGGRIAWEIGGERLEPGNDFAGQFFLGPPLSCDGKLFALSELQGEMRLVVLEADANGMRKIWSQPLVAPSLKISENEERRRLGLMPACSNGIVVCPTDTGAVIAVDFALRRLLWGYQYVSTSAAVAGVGPMMGGGFVRMNQNVFAETSDDGWVDGTPIVADGRVFVTPTDSDELHCLNLADGKLIWKIPRERAVYLAGADDQRAVLVGTDRIDAVKATDGTPAWADAVHIPPPTGRGVWMQQRYLVPLSTGEIATIDLNQGRLLARSKLPSSRVPGNLAAGHGSLVSMSSRELLGFRSLEETDALITEKLAADPQDGAALALRGEVRLHRGEFEAGLKDLRAAIASKPQPYVKSVLAAALLVGLRTDFARYQNTVPELEALTDDPQQRSEFVWLAARGMKDSGQPLAAFARMMRLIDGSLDEFSVEGIDSPWQARNDRRLAGLFASLYRAATVEDRRKLDDEIRSRLPAADSDDEVNSLRRFLRAFGFHPAAITARQQLAAKLDLETDTVEYVMELSRLAQSSDAAVAAPAAGKLAKWFLARKRFDDVTAWLSPLAGRLADANVEPDVTGKQLADQLRADADYVESLKQFVPWPEGHIEPKRSNQANNNGRMVRAHLAGPVPAHYQGWSFETDLQGTMLIARDDLARFRWRLNRMSPRNNDQQQFFGEVPAGLHQVHLYDHLVAWSMGAQFLVAADLEPERNAPKILWQESLIPPGSNPQLINARLMNMQRAAGMGRRRVMVNQPFVNQSGAGAVIAITDSAVIYHNGRKLFAADPLSGKLLWSRKDIPRSSFEVHADDQSVAVLDHTRAPGEPTAPINLLRAIDGDHVQMTETPAGVVEWIGGSRVVTAENSAQRTTGPVPLALYDLVRGEAVWRAELARPAAVRVWNQSEVWTVEENRRLTVRHLADGTIRWTQELKLEVPVEAVFVQHWHDRALVVLGSTTPAPALPGSARVVGFDNHHTPINGYAAALKHETGELLWQTTINDTLEDPTAYDASQPPGWPVLMFAGRMFVTPQPGVAAPMLPRLTTTLIDKQTGKRIYSAEEPSNINTYFIEADPERRRWTANFLTWSVDLHFTGKPRK